jgi:hypothetical protein
MAVQIVTALMLLARQVEFMNGLLYFSLDFRASSAMSISELV